MTEIITTRGELDALPEATVLRSSKRNRKSGFGCLIQVAAKGRMSSVDGVYELHGDMTPFLPATVLSRPDAWPVPATITAERREQIVKEVDAAACWPATAWNPSDAELTSLLDAVLTVLGIEVSL